MCPACPVLFKTLATEAGQVRGSRARGDQPRPRERATSRSMWSAAGGGGGLRCVRPPHDRFTLHPPSRRAPGTCPRPFGPAVASDFVATLSSVRPGGGCRTRRRATRWMTDARLVGVALDTLGRDAVGACVTAPPPPPFSAGLGAIPRQSSTRRRGPCVSQRCPPPPCTSTAPRPEKRR